MESSLSIVGVFGNSIIQFAACLIFAAFIAWLLEIV